MGTNYYAHLDVCKHCGRAEETIHIGKKSYGWQFSFHGTDSLRSWQDWKTELQRPATQIYDEYGERIIFGKFREMVEASKDEKLNHHDWCHAKPEHPSYLSTLWKDDEGWSFSEGEFS